MLGSESMEQPGTLEISELLNCSICMEGYDSINRQPKLLPCHHTFCKVCLGNLFTSTGQFLCPTCREHVMLRSPPPHGVARLQTNFYIMQMRDYLHHDPKAKGCEKHNNDLNFFCLTCEIPICSACLSSEHKETAGHQTLDLEAAKREQISELSVKMAVAQQTLLQYEQKLKQYEIELNSLSTAKVKALQDVNSVFDKYVELLNTRRQNMTEEIMVQFTQRKSILKQDLETVKVIDTSLNGLLEQVKDSISNGSISDLFAYKAKLSARNSQLEQDKHLLEQDMNENYIKFETDELEYEFMNTIPRLGSVTVKKHLPCTVKVTKSNAVASLFTNFTVIVSDANGENLDNYPISIEITDPHDDAIPNLVKCHSNGRYEVTFRPEISGRHRIEVKFLNHLISNGMFALEVQSNEPVSVIGGQDDENIEMDFPRSVAVDMKNNLYVVDTGNNRIQIFDKSGSYISAFPISNASDVYSSCGLAVDDVHGTLICPEVCVHDADLLEASTILMYNLEGKLLERYNYQDIMSQALSVAVDSSCHMIIADYELNTIFVFDKSGRLLHKFGESGLGPGKFNNPTFLCTGLNDNIFVSDGNNHRIQVFDHTGHFLYQFGEYGTGKGQFNMPFGIAADFHGNLLVVDGGNKRVQIFNQDGEFLSCIESLGNRLSAPRGIAVTSDGYVLVADRDNHCVKKFRYLHCTSI